MRNKAFNFSPLVIFCLLILITACRTQTATEINVINGRISGQNSTDTTAGNQTNELQTNKVGFASAMKCAPEKLEPADVLTIDFPKTPHGGFMEIITPARKFIFLTAEQTDELLENAKAADVSPYYSAAEFVSLARLNLDTGTATTIDYERKPTGGKYAKTKIFSQSGWYSIKLSETHFEQDDPLITAECRVYYGDSSPANRKTREFTSAGQTAGKDELIDSVKTSKGELRLVKQIEDEDAAQVFIKLGDQILLEAPYETADFKKVAGENAPNLFLVFLGTDSLQCIGKFVVVDLSQAAKVSKEFGNCSDAPQIIYQNQTLTLTFPDGAKDDGKYKIGKKEVWQYRGGQLKKLS